MDEPVIQLNSAIKTYTYDQDKVISPYETVKKVYAAISSSGRDILTDLVRVPNPFHIPMYLAKGGIDFIKTINLAHTTGKGVSNTQAQASALMEMIERFSSASYKYEINASYNEVKDNAPDFKSLLPLLKHIEQEDSIIEELKNIPLQWAPSYNLTRKKNTLLPSLYGEIVMSNGLAAGNTIEEAIIQGICEITERHVISEIEINKLNTPSINLDSIKNPMILQLINKYIEADMEIILKDFTLGMGIPTIGIIGYYSSSAEIAEVCYVDAGTHTDPIKALFRALTELPQCIRNFSRRQTDEEKNKFSNQGIIFSGVVNKNNSFYLEESEKTIDFDSILNSACGDIKDEIDMATDVLARKGIEIIVLNKTHPLLNIPVVRVAGLNSSLNVFSTKRSIYYYQAMCYQKTGQIDKAIEAFNNENAIKPEADIYKEIGLCYNILYKSTRNTDYRDIAINNFKKSIELSPVMPNVLVYCQLASMMLDMGNKTEATDFFTKALKLNPMYKNTPLYDKFIKNGIYMKVM